MWDRSSSATQKVKKTPEPAVNFECWSAWPCWQCLLQPLQLGQRGEKEEWLCQQRGAQLIGT